MALRATALRVVLAGLLLLLAGCGGLAGDPTTPDAGTVTPVPVPTDSPTPPPERAPVPAPLAGETPNETALARLHAESLSRRSYRLQVYASESWGAGPGQAVQNRLDQRSYRVQSGGTYRAARVLLVVGSGPASRLPRWQAYADGEAEYRRVVGDDGVSFERRSLAPAALPPHQGRTVAMLIRYLDVGEATVEHVLTDRGARLRVVGRDPRAPELRNVSAYRAEAVVTGSGRVELLRVRYVTADGVSVRTGFRVRDVGSVRVAPPDWYGRARAETLGIGGATDSPEPPTAATATPTGGTPNGTAGPTPVPERTTRKRSVGSRRERPR